MSYRDIVNFDPSDPFQNSSIRDEELFPAPPIVRVEGWRSYVNRSNALKPVMPSASVFEAMSKDALREFNSQRRKYHAKLPHVETPTLSKVHAEAISLAVHNYSAPAGARMGIVLDGLGTVGKSTIAVELGKKYELSWRKRMSAHPNSQSLHTAIPVIYVSLSGELSIKDFNRQIISFMGISAPKSASTSWLNDSIIDATQACVTSLIIIDDIHYLQMRNKTAMAVNNHLKFLASCISATFVYAGIHVEGSGLLLEGKSKENAFASQTQHRFKTYSISPFSKYSEDMVRLLGAFESNLALMKQENGSLAALSDYVHDRTGGFIGSISDLIREGANMAIQTGTERLTRSVLDKVQLDYASEMHRKNSPSKIAK